MNQLIGTLVALAVFSSANALRPDSARLPELVYHPSVQRDLSKDLAIIVNKSNSVRSLTLGELREYFRADRNWPDSQKVTVVMLKRGNPGRESVLRTIYGSREEDIYRDYLLRKNFAGEQQDLPTELASTTSALDFVRAVEGAIGYVPADEVDASVKVMLVEGLAPGEAGYKIKAKLTK